ncbi:MAG TPA: hypothetical protein VK859_10440 [bacterium]|jgi:hypothetical protein|nr:hypothetical protein [bacterium]
MRKTVLFLTAFFLTAAWETAVADGPTANPTREARKAEIKRMEAMHEAHRKHAHVKKISGTVDKSLKPQATVGPAR